MIQLLGDKSKAPQVFLGAMGTACTVYMALGGIAAYYFGIDPHYGIQKLITLNWRNYNGDEDPALAGDVFTIFVSYLIRLYPVVSVTSAFTLYADTVGNTARGYFALPSPTNPAPNMFLPRPDQNILPLDIYLAKLSWCGDSS